VVGRDNAHIPKESWPAFTWYLIEFAIVFAVANLIAFQIIPMVDEMVGEKSLLICEQESWKSDCAPSEEKMSDTGLLNWIYWGMVGGVFIGWYLLIRGFILKNQFLEIVNHNDRLFYLQYWLPKMPLYDYYMIHIYHTVLFHYYNNSKC